MKNKRLIIILSVTAAILLLPFIAMQLHAPGVDWSGADFLIMGILLTGTGLACEFVLRRVKDSRRRLILCGVILFAFFLIWAELAVGIFNTPFAGS
jgi:Kef-type K+ transport system membrane component KefB